jgi:hypothetical protein
MTVVFYVSGHGFGHASRETQVIDALARLRPGLRIVVRTTVPRWFLANSLTAAVEIVDGAVDTGVVQPDSLSIDEDETARHAARFYGQFDRHVEREAALLRYLGAALVVADIPPVAFAAAAIIGIPSIALANFTWDWIYEGFPGFSRLAPAVVHTIATAYAEATLALRLPFAGGFASMLDIEDLPMIGRRATTPAGDVRRRLDLEQRVPLVLASFGGHGRSVKLECAVSPHRFTIVATDYEWPHGPRPLGLRIIDAATLRAAGVSYTDLLAACDAVATKLGFGIVAECIANHVPMLYTFRGRFVEQETFVHELPGVLRCRFISRDDLVAGRWADAIDALLAQPMPTTHMRIGGAEAAASRIAGFLVS